MSNVTEPFKVTFKPAISSLRSLKLSSRSDPLPASLSISCARVSPMSFIFSDIVVSPPSEWVSWNKRFYVTERWIRTERQTGVPEGREGGFCGVAFCSWRSWKINRSEGLVRGRVQGSRAWSYFYSDDC